MTSDNKNPENLPRRKALLGLTAGASVITVWHKPIVNSVVLPAHALTSEPLPTDFFGDNVTASVVQMLDQNQGSPLDWLVPDAYAGVAEEGQGGVGQGQVWGVKAIASGDNAYEITILNPDMDAVRSGTLNIDGSAGVLAVTQNPCQFYPRNFNATIQSVDAAALVVQIDRRSGSDGGIGGFLSLRVLPGTGSDLVATCEL